MTKNRIIGSALVLLGLLVALTPRYILPVCEYYGKPKMACSYTGRAEIFMGIVIASIAVGAFMSKAGIKWLMFSALVSSASVVFMPEIIGYCANPQMPCHYGTVPMLRLLGGLSALVSVVGFILSRKD